jgi:hypothetical protein
VTRTAREQPHTFWAPVTGREPDNTPLREGTHARVVACLNVWNDLHALKYTLPTWIKHVDAVLAVDGAYAGTADEQPLSTDGTREYLASHSKVQIIDAGGLDQCGKRSVYLKLGRPGDLLVILDADEFVTHPELLRSCPTLDVGWVRIVSSMYVRSYGQPRVIRWMPGLEYRGRHHWIYHEDRLLCTHQYGGPGYAHRPLPLTLENQRGLGRVGDRLTVKRNHHHRQVAGERPLIAMPPFSTASDSQLTGRESLNIVHHAYRDDGIAPSRLHAAINRTTPHASLFFKQRPGPFGAAGQFMVKDHATHYTRALQSADVLHFHGAMSHSRMYGRGKPIVFHHHGSLLRANVDSYMKAARDVNALILVSNLELLTYTGEEGHYLPNTVPVARYRALRNQEALDSGPLRIAHSPSQPHRKGTDKLVEVVRALQKRGREIELVMIHDVSHSEALRLKATCHLAFDSFWLGIQCSGIECAAMGLPVIAGDVTVRDRYRERFGACPYTFAENQEELEAELVRLVSDRAYYRAEADRVNAYVTTYHDESAVTLRYLDLLDDKYQWRTTVRAGKFIPRAGRLTGTRR